MPNRLEIPAELLALVEKRELADRRQSGEVPAANVPAESLDLEDRRHAARRADEAVAASASGN